MCNPLYSLKKLIKLLWLWKGSRPHLGWSMSCPTHNFSHFWYLYLNCIYFSYVTIFKDKNMYIYITLGRFAYYFKSHLIFLCLLSSVKQECLWLHVSWPIRSTHQEAGLVGNFYKQNYNLWTSWKYKQLWWIGKRPGFAVQRETFIFLGYYLK